jgi:hypothetical protein
MVAIVVLCGCTKGADQKQPGSGADVAPAATATADAATATDSDAAQHAACCNQCSAAAGRDPAGMDIATKDCRSYAGEFNGGPGVDDACLAHFKSVPTLLGDCWKLDPNKPNQ